MRRALLVVPVSVVLSVLGCGGSSTPATITPPPTYPSVTGNWQGQTDLTASTVTVNTAIQLYAGSIVSSGATVTATLMFRGLIPGTSNPCATQPAVPMTGSVTSAGAVTLTGAVAGGTATLTFNVTSPLAVKNSGTVMVVGGTCPTVAEAFVFTHIPNLTGTYGGNVTPSYGTQTQNALPAVLQLTQSDSPDSMGQFPLTGTYTMSVPNCPTTQSVTGTVDGLSYTLASAASSSGQVALMLSGNFDPTVTPVQMSVNGSVQTSSTCNVSNLMGLLMKQ